MSGWSFWVIWSDYLLTFGSVLGSPGQHSSPQQLPVVLEKVVSAEDLAVAHPAVGFGLELSGDLPQLLVLVHLRVYGGDRVLDALQGGYQVLVLPRPR